VGKKKSVITGARGSSLPLAVLREHLGRRELDSNGCGSLILPTVMQSVKRSKARFSPSDRRALFGGGVESGRDAGASLTNGVRISSWDRSDPMTGEGIGEGTDGLGIRGVGKKKSVIVGAGGSSFSVNTVIGERVAREDGWCACRHLSIQRLRLKAKSLPCREANRRFAFLRSVSGSCGSLSWVINQETVLPEGRASQKATKSSASRAEP
jgi:hypothetical protein